MLKELRDDIYEWGGRLTFALAILFILAGLILTQARASEVDANGSTVLGGAPHGCPFRAFCGCALAKHLGLNDRRLWLAWNWARLFPRTSPHPGAVAVRHHHVLLLERQVSSRHWQVFDPNSGGHLTRRHVRDIAGFIFVDPSQRRIATNE